MDDTQLIEADLVVDDENLLIKTEIQNLDDIAVDNDAEEDFVATLGKESVAGVPSKRFCNLLKTVQWNMATKDNLGGVVTTCERSWVQASPWGFSFRSINGGGDDKKPQRNNPIYYLPYFPFPFPFISCRSPMGAHNKNSLQSKANQTVRISKSVFVSNFPEGCTAKDLWKAKGHLQTGSYVNVVNGSSPVGVHGPFISSASVLVLDDSCVAERDLSNHVMGIVKDVSSISNLRTLIMEEGFSVVNLVYLGGLWVMIECDNVETKANMLQQTGVKSWFHVLQNVIHDFVSDKQIVLMDIKGIPLNVWSRETFTRIRKKWGEALDIEDNVDSSFRRKCLCIKTKLPLSILESFKVIFKGNVYMVRAKELFTWSLIFLGQKEMEYTSDEDSDVGPQKVPDRLQFCEEGPNDDRVGDIEEVSETNFGDNSSIPINHIDELEKQHKEIPVVVNAKVMDNSQDVYKEASCDNVDPNVVKKGGSVLGIMEDMIRVGKAMGYSMDGCVKDLEQIIGTQGVGDVPK
nr:RNA-directed DNA polymerase, eukaryota [Tanacetum cinerariifolium]